MMRLHPMAIALVKQLIKEGKAGDKPFGIPLEVWLAQIKEDE